MVDNKLKIRIQIKQTPSTPDDLLQEDETSLISESDVEQYPLDWTKISIVVLLLVSVLGFIVYSVLDPDANEQSTEKTIEPSIAPNVELKEKPYATNENTISSNDTSSASTSTANAPKINGSNNDGRKTSAKIDSPPIPVREKPIAAPQLNKSIIIPAKKPQQPQQQKKTAETTTESINQTYVARALLTQTIQGREPKDSIDSVSLKNGEVKTIYFYLHLTNLQGKTVTISWYHNGKQDSKLSMQVHHQSWRTHASKLLNQKRLGFWRAELTDESGNTLAVKNFTVVQS